jgi:hypothetical protein
LECNTKVEKMSSKQKTKWLFEDIESDFLPNTRQTQNPVSIAKNDPVPQTLISEVDVISEMAVVDSNHISYDELGKDDFYKRRLRSDRTWFHLLFLLGGLYVYALSDKFSNYEIRDICDYSIMILLAFNLVLSKKLVSNDNYNAVIAYSLGSTLFIIINLHSTLLIVSTWLIIALMGIGLYCLIQDEFLEYFHTPGSQMKFTRILRYRIIFSIIHTSLIFLLFNLSFFFFFG